MHTEPQNADYRTADLPADVVGKLKSLEDEIRLTTDKNVVLIAYENDKQK